MPKHAGKEQGDKIHARRRAQRQPVNRRLDFHLLVIQPRLVQNATENHYNHDKYQYFYQQKYLFFIHRKWGKLGVNYYYFTRRDISCQDGGQGICWEFARSFLGIFPSSFQKSPSLSQNFPSKCCTNFKKFFKKMFNKNGIRVIIYQE